MKLKSVKEITPHSDQQEWIKKDRQAILAQLEEVVEKLRPDYGDFRPNKIEMAEINSYNLALTDLLADIRLMFK